MLVAEFESRVDTILMGFGINNDNFLEIIVCNVELGGPLPCQLPADMDTVEAQQEDISRDMVSYVDAEGKVYDFTYALN